MAVEYTVSEPCGVPYPFALATWGWPLVDFCSLPFAVFPRC